MANRMAMVSKIAKKVVNEGAQSVGKAGESVMHGEVSAAARVGNVRSLPLGTDESKLWDTAMQNAEGGTMEDLQNAYRKLSTNNRVVENIDASKAARQGSGFGKFVRDENRYDKIDKIAEDVHNERARQLANPSKTDFGLNAYRGETAKTADRMGSVDTYHPGNAYVGDSLRKASDLGTYHADPLPRAKPATSVMDSPAASTKLDTGSGFGGGVGQEAADTAQASTGKVQEIFQKAREDAKAKLESNQPVPQNAGFGGGAGQEGIDPMGSFFEDSLSKKGLSNADRHKLERVRDDYQNYMAEIGEANGSQEEIAKVRDKYGIKGQSDPVDHFTAKANEDATTMDWMMGNHVPQYAAGSLMLGGAVAACFSNKGKMSNSELYGQNF